MANTSIDPASPAGSRAKRPSLRPPFSPLWPIVAGVLAGLLIRFVFSGRPGGAYAAMLGSFIYLAPLAVGAVTVYVAELIQRRDLAYFVFAPAIANVLFIAGTLVIMIEGLICAVLIVPLFAVQGAIGGLIMGGVCRLTRWPKQAVYSFAALPLLLGAVEHRLPLPDQVSSIERSVLIQASSADVWRQIHDATAISPDEVQRGWAYRIGVPLPLAGVTEETSEGRVRKVTMGKGVHFDQVVVDWEEARYVRWKYRFHPDSFPPQALDDHVMIGGHYFDVIDTSYSLTPVAKGTEVKIRMTYRVSTSFNWYADWIARGLLGNVQEVLLDLYKSRSERASVPG